MKENSKSALSAQPTLIAKDPGAGRGEVAAPSTDRWGAPMVTTAACGVSE